MSTSEVNLSLSGILNKSSDFCNIVGNSLKEVGYGFQRAADQSFANDILRFHCNHPWFGCWGFYPSVFTYQPLMFSIPSIYSMPVLPSFPVGGNNYTPLNIGINDYSPSTADTMQLVESLGRNFPEVQPEQTIRNNIRINDNTSATSTLRLVSELGRNVPETQPEQTISNNIEINDYTSAANTLRLISDLHRDLPESQDEESKPTMRNITINDSTSAGDVLAVMKELSKGLPETNNPQPYQGGFSGEIPQGQTQYNPNGSTDSALDFLDRNLHPEKYANNCGGGTQKPAESSVRTVDVNGNDTTPTWYKEISDRTDRHLSINANQRALKDTFDSMGEKYNPYRKENGQYVQRPDGTRELNSFGKEIHKLMCKMAGHDRNGIDSLFKKFSLEELAAIEFHFNVLTNEYQSVTGGKSLREMLKDASLYSWATWSGVNTDKCEKWFDKLDEAAMTNPRSTAYALYQAFNNHRMFGCGFDEARVLKLLKNAVKDSTFKKAVEEEFNKISNMDLGSAIEDKWFKSAELIRIKEDNQL